MSELIIPRDLNELNRDQLQSIIHILATRLQETEDIRESDDIGWYWECCGEPIWKDE